MFKITIESLVEIPNLGPEYLLRDKSRYRNSLHSNESFCVSRAKKRKKKKEKEREEEKIKSKLCPFMIANDLINHVRWGQYHISLFLRRCTSYPYINILP